ncbi:amino acid ABC transporter ATP-binding/permease protein [Treponema sp.]|uniref:amino acid ABC transporter ATP-binding/permease protein n=1 Tax=Treponema sp. TaxID=166 RepID=UPI0025F94EDB|nr:ABC transporter ATP-binding protein [Treponema sp.]
MKTLIRLSKLILPLFPVMLLAIIFGSAGYLCAIAIPAGGAAAITYSFPVKFLILIGIARGVLHYLEQYCNHYIAFSILARIRNIVFNKLRKLGPAKLDSKDKGSLISLLTSDVELLEVFYAHTVSPAAIALVVTVIMLVFFFHFHYLLAISAFVSYFVIGIFVPALVSKPAFKSASLFRKKFASINSILLDNLRGLEQSLLYSKGQDRLKEISDTSAELSQAKKSLAINEGINSAITGLLVTAASMAMLFTSLYLYKKNIISFNAVILCTTAQFSSFGPVLALAALGTSLSSTIASGKRVLSLLDEDAVAENISGMEETSFDGAEVKDLSFSYKKKGENILSDINMTFPKNKILGIKGKSGSGKSTLIKLLMRFWKNDQGKILISQKDINLINTKDLRDMESYVTQETVLFHDTIENNIRIAKLNATREEIIEACKKACIHDFIMELPQGYETMVSELGDNFSGGERQRLSLARAFLHDADFILLDEPSSNLDSYNEHMIMEAVKKEADGKTVIIVSHRDSTFEYADTIWNLTSGRQS